MIPAKRLAEIRKSALDGNFARPGRLFRTELIELVTAYEAARELAWSGGRGEFERAYGRLSAMFKSEPTK